MVACNEKYETSLRQTQATVLRKVRNGEEKGRMKGEGGSLKQKNSNLKLA